MKRNEDSFVDFYAYYVEYVYIYVMYINSTALCI